MKTKQEQIKKMSNIITDCLCKDCKNCKYYNGHFCTEKDTGKAEALMQAGYGDISEYKAEIERLTAERNAYKQRYESSRKKYESFVKSSVESSMKKEGSRKNDIKQAQIDALNKVMTYVDGKIENDYGDMSDSVEYLTINIDEFDDFIDELIKEIKEQ